MKWLMIVKEPNAPKNLLDKEIRECFKEFNWSLIDGEETLKDFVKHLEEKVKNAHTKHPRCSPFRFTTSDKIGNLNAISNHDFIIWCAGVTAMFYPVKQYISVIGGVS